MNTLSRWMTLFLLIALLSPIALSTTTGFAAPHRGIAVARKDKKEPRKPKPKPGPRGDDGDDN